MTQISHKPRTSSHRTNKTMYRNEQNARRTWPKGRLQYLADVCSAAYSGIRIPNLWTPRTKHSTTAKTEAVSKRKMDTVFVTVNHVPVRVDCWGDVTPNTVLNDPSTKPDELVLVVPGNPGVTKFYHRFANHVHDNVNKPVWVVSHGGHDKVRKAKLRPPSLRRNSDLYTLKGQVEQKKQFIETYLKGVKLHCVGHSIGSKMLLDVLKTSEDSDIEQCFFLFPTVERMAETRNGKILMAVVNYILWLTIFGSYLFIYLPRVVQLILLRIYCFVTRMSPDNMGSILELVDPHVLRNVFFLAEDEMKTVLALDEEPFTKHGEKLRLYYGATDGWTPPHYCEELKKKFPEVKAEICSKGYQHAFVLQHSKEVADMVASWVNSGT